jgi:nitrogen regulatory protein P-II 1
MKLVIAYIRPERLNAVKQALYANEIYSMTVTNVLGSGRQMGFTETYRGVVMEVNLLKKIRVEIGVTEEYVDKAVEAVESGAKTGNPGDGVIFVMEIGKAKRIRTGETDNVAVGATRSAP